MRDPGWRREMMTIDRIQKQQEAELLKNSLDSLYLLRDRIESFTPEDNQKFSEAIQAIQALSAHLEIEHKLPHWRDVWGERAGWVWKESMK